MNYWLVILIACGYLLLLFALAYYIDKRAQKGKSILKNPYVYALSLAVYCSAWTYYGSVGKATNDGLSFLAIYIGPLLVMPLLWIITRKTIRISKALRIITLADFIATRFGRSITISMLIAIGTLLGIIPYIAIQLKAVSSAVDLLTGNQQSGYQLGDSGFIIATILTVFILVFAMRHLDKSAQHDGIIGAIAFESIVKLLAFVAVGIFVTYGLFDGFADLYSRASVEQKANFSQMNDPAWAYMIFISMAAFLLLPRQFHVMVAENTEAKHLKTAAWVFPLYLVLINVFVIPIAIGGRAVFGAATDPDTFVLALPMHFDHDFLALFTFIGGFSAATGMIIIATLALSLMVSNNLIMPLVIKTFDYRKFDKKLANTLRRLSVVFIMALAYLYFEVVAEKFPLVSIGLISFVAIAQFLPAYLASLYWENANRTGVVWSILVGLAVWAYTLIFPSLASVGWLPTDWLTEGPLSISGLKPGALFGTEFSDPIAHATFWSISLNTLAFIGANLLSTTSTREINMAKFYTEGYKQAAIFKTQISWTGKLNAQAVENVLVNIFGERHFQKEKQQFETQNGPAFTPSGTVTPKFLNHVEILLTSALGATSARILISSMAQVEEVPLSDLVMILKESTEITRLNLELKQKSEELAKANDRLRNLDKEKDEFISTVTHELRTPLTSIRAMSELLQDMPELTEEEKEGFLEKIIKETERMTRLINQVLDLEKLHRGETTIHLEPADMVALVTGVINEYKYLANEKKIAFQLVSDENTPLINIDKDRITQVVVNLLANAIKFSPELTTIHVEIKKSAGQLITSITDEGPGIDEENIGRIFEKFYQVRDQNRKKPIGSGLGLAICRSIIALHGGDINVANTKEKGAMFTFSIPFTPTHTPHE